MPGIARIGDIGLVHCSGYSIVSGSTDVLANGRGVARIGDKSGPHLMPAGKKCKPHTSTIANGAAQVLVNGRPAARIGSGLTMCTRIISGSLDVLVGP